MNQNSAYIIRNLSNPNCQKQLLEIKPKIFDLISLLPFENPGAQLFPNSEFYQILEQIINTFYEIDEIKILLDGSAKVKENYTVKEHTLRVLYQLVQQYRFFNLNQVQKQLTKNKLYNKLNIKQFMVILCVVHDIGKSLGDIAAEQHIYTIPCLGLIMTGMQLDQSQILLTEVLVDNDILGEWQQNKVPKGTTIKQVKIQLNEYANKVQMTVQQYFQIQKALYLSDSSSYPLIVQYHMQYYNEELKFKNINNEESRLQKLTNFILKE